MASERVQKILAHAGIASRRKAEEMITEGLVTINGKVAKLGDKADLREDAIKVNGKLLRSVEAPVYLAFYKPRGVLSTLSDPDSRPTITDYLAKVRSRVFPIGRLDFNSEGLLLLTNDGDFAEKMQKRDDIPRVYQVKVRGRMTREMVERLKRPLKIGNRRIELYSARVAEELSANTKVEVVVMGAAATDLKAFFEQRGFLVIQMVRTAIGHLTLRGLAPGHFRPLKASQAESVLNQPELGMRLIKDGIEESEEREAREEARLEKEREYNEGKRPLKLPVPQLKKLRTESFGSVRRQERADTPFEAGDRTRGPRDKRRPGSSKPLGGPARGGRPGQRHPKKSW
jgi:pseudouridine synthase